MWHWGDVLQPRELKALHLVYVPQAAVGWWSVHWFKPRLEGPIWKPRCNNRLSSSFHPIGSAVTPPQLVLFHTAGTPDRRFSRTLLYSVVVSVWPRHPFASGGTAWGSGLRQKRFSRWLRCKRSLRPYTLCRCRKPRLAGGPSTGSDLASRATYGNRIVTTA